MDWGPVSTYLWGYTPYLNVFLCRAAALNTGPVPNHWCTPEILIAVGTPMKTWKDIFALFSDPAPNLPL